jgi:hypothetical protein
VARPTSATSRVRCLGVNQRAVALLLLDSTAANGVGAENPVASCDLHVLAQQATEPVSS